MKPGISEPSPRGPQSGRVFSSTIGLGESTFLVGQKNQLICGPWGLDSDNLGLIP